jgi:hypothetical protein
MSGCELSYMLFILTQILRKNDIFANNGKGCIKVSKKRRFQKIFINHISSVI